jgi:hypothetical protein
VNLEGVPRLIVVRRALGRAVGSKFGQVNYIVMHLLNSQTVKLSANDCNIASKFVQLAHSLKREILLVQTSSLNKYHDRRFPPHNLLELTSKSIITATS